MTDVTKMPDRKIQHEKTDNASSDSLRDLDQAGPAMPDNPAWCIKRPRAWPFKPRDGSSLSWWRTLPSDSFREPERQLLLATLERISVLHGGDDLAAALHGDAAAAIGAALDLMPIGDITLQVDIKLTALMRTALDGKAASALVMGQILGLTDVGHELATELAASWLSYGEQLSDEPHKFRQAKVALVAAFEERWNRGDNA